MSESPQRWGDAPVHSIAASLFAPKDKIHFFTDIGYRHGPYQHCPQGNFHSRGKCWCDANDNFGVFAKFSSILGEMLIFYRLRWLFVYGQMGQLMEVTLYRTSMFYFPLLASYASNVSRIFHHCIITMQPACPILSKTKKDIPGA